MAVKKQSDAQEIAQAARNRLGEMFQRDTEEDVEPLGGLLKPPAPGTELFEGQVKTMTVTKDVNVAQLMDEIDERLNDVDRFQVVCQIDDDEAPVSEENKLTIYIHGDPDMRTVRGVIESHEKNRHHGLSEGEVRVEQLKEKLRSGKDLPATELNELLRAIL